MTAVAISSLSAVTWTNTSDGLPLPAATLNSGINNIDSLGNNLLIVAQQQEAMWASAAASAPTDKPAGKIWFQTDTKLWMGYPTLNGTALPLVQSTTAIPPVVSGPSALNATYAYPDIAVRTLGVVGLDSTNSNTALTSTSSQAVGAILTLPANALNANGRAYRASVYVDTNNAAASFTMQIRFNGQDLLKLTGGGNLLVNGNAATLCVQLILIRVNTTHAMLSAFGVLTQPTVNVQVVGFPENVNNPGDITVTNWTSAINFDVNISAYTSGTIRSMIIGEQVG